MREITDLNINDAERAEPAKAKMVRYLSCAETAKLVREALKASFPGMAFSVKSRTYSGGASIDVAWTDGPTVDEVDTAILKFEGAQFDGMIDLKTYKAPTELNGELVRFGADYIHTMRNYSAEFLAECAATIAQQYGIPVPKVMQSTSTYSGKAHTSVWLEQGGPALDRGNCASTASDKTSTLAQSVSRYSRSDPREGTGQSH